MTDLTTMHLKCLLEKATPGPWESYSGVAGVPEGWDEYWAILQMGHHRLPLRSPHDPLEDEEYANFDLAAAAPELAEEVLRMRRELESMQSAWLLMYADPELTPTEQEFAAHVVDHIDSVLGDHDE